ncbi:MAG: hypothetical protein KatS3mg110_3396 [Pirellulaceae bacterium]|nr:MAG: hypothetical protein KatS3mg110_3396 [Pirellulaceae bacterium]
MKSTPILVGSRGRHTVRWHLLWGLVGVVLIWAVPVEAYAGRARSGWLRRLLAPRCNQPVPAAAASPAAGEPATESPAAPADSEPSPSDQPARPQSTWRELFDGKSLADWKPTPFGGEGEVRVEDGMMIIEMGETLTGVNYTGPIPRTNYEVEIEAMRRKGIDFFCGFTFPVGDSYCSFIVGGWAGGVVGLSCIDGRDASENETTRYMTFDDNRWYRIRVRVTPELIAAWIDDQNVVYQDIRGRKISTRVEVDASQPFGLATWQTEAAIRRIRLRLLTPDEAKSATP